MVIAGSVAAAALIAVGVNALRNRGKEDNEIDPSQAHVASQSMGVERSQTAARGQG
jgi:hypothetical protein